MACMRYCASLVREFAAFLEFLNQKTRQRLKEREDCYPHVTEKNKGTDGSRELPHIKQNAWQTRESNLGFRGSSLVL